MSFKELFFSNDARDIQQVFASLDQSMARIEFDPQGHVLDANQNFLALSGYSLQEIKGRHHRLFVPEGEGESAEYKAFWNTLRNGEPQQATFLRLGRNGKRIWMEATYSPVVDPRGRTIKVVKLATDVSERVAERSMLQSVFKAIDRSQAVIEFDPQGHILTANENFLKLMGYSLEEIRGRHHSIFVEPEHRQSKEYAAFWQNLAAGQFHADQFKRLAKDGSAVWIEATYNPILDHDGKPLKVVKFASNVTEQINILLKLKSIIDTNFAEIDTRIVGLDTASNKATGMAEEASSMAREVAASAEELASTVNHISQNMIETRDSTERMLTQTRTANDSTRRMADSASAMGSVIETIQNIASQIDLLALNAAIESARAGEAGKGFAVVASEVKTLAGQAAQATERISQQIGTMQEISASSVRALEIIQESVQHAKDNAVEITSGLEQQSAVTGTVSQNIVHISRTLEGVSDSISTIRDASAQVAESVKQTRGAAEVLAQ